MNLKAMNMFLSEDNIKRHLEHLRTQKLRFSIIEKSFPEIKRKEMNEIVRLNISKDVKDEALSLLGYIKAHECFFDSFTEIPKRSDEIMKHYASRESFIYNLYTAAKDKKYGFLFVYKDKYGIPRFVFSEENEGAFLRYEPLLAIDLYEHVYFNDYGFAKDKYLRSALEYFDLERLKSAIDKSE